VTTVRANRRGLMVVGTGNRLALLDDRKGLIRWALRKQAQERRKKEKQS